MRINRGVAFAAIAYIVWGAFPIYFKLLSNVPAIQIVSHRVVWSFLFLLFLVTSRQQLADIKSAINQRTLLIYLAAGTLLTLNWLTYVWGVNAGYVVETSLGYFINPLVSILLGVIFLREKLRLTQWIPIGLAASGVIYLTFVYGSLPWIALVLAFSFGTYGLVKKIAPLGSLYGLTLETGMIFIPATLYLLTVEFQGSGSFGHGGTITTILLLLSGVITAIPLLMFAIGARSVPLSTIGLLQYISPTLQFLVGVFLYKEAFDQHHLIGFCVIWLALILLSAEGLVNQLKTVSVPVELPF